VERVALALAHKRIAVESIWIDPDDRSRVREVSGQELVPVLIDDGRVVADSTRILEYLEQEYPEPPLYPRDEPRRAEMVLFIDWFNRVWKRPPNEIETELGKDHPDRGKVRALAEEMSGSLELFESLLAGREYLLGDFSAADCAAFPFLRYARGAEEGDEELFHAILVEHLALGAAYPRLRAWIARVDERPRA
jgi:glutathione S-transferase